LEILQGSDESMAVATVFFDNGYNLFDAHMLSLPVEHGSPSSTVPESSQNQTF
jgi:hypothetical protein